MQTISWFTNKSVAFPEIFHCTPHPAHKHLQCKPLNLQEMLLILRVEHSTTLHYIDHAEKFACRSGMGRTSARPSYKNSETHTYMYKRKCIKMKLNLSLISLLRLYT